MSAQKMDDADLLLAAAGGDERAFEAFYGRWLAPITAFHLRATGSRELALDLAAETFAAVVSSAERFDPVRGSAAGWLFAIARHKLQASFRTARAEASARRQLGWERVFFDDADLRRVEELASLGELTLDQLLSELPADQRIALRQRVIFERPYAAIASEMACSEMLVRQRVHRALHRLRSRLEQPA